MNFFESIQQISSQVTQMKESLGRVVVEGDAGGGMVKISMNGQFVVQKVQIDDGLLQVDKKVLLEELVQAAFVNASGKIRAQLQNMVGNQQPPA